MTTTITKTEAVAGDEDDARSSDTPTERVRETPLKVVEEEGHSKSSVGEQSDAGLQKKVKKAPQTH
jgi:hypothetical protein